MQTYVIIGFVSLLVVFLITKGIYLLLQSKLRQRDLSDWCEANHFSFSRKSNEFLDNSAKEISQVSEGRDQIIFNVLTGRVGGLDVTLFDCEYTTGSRGTNSTQNVQTVIRLQCDELELPKFTLTRQVLLHNLAMGFGLQDINFDSHPSFSKQYLLRGANENAVRELFTSRVLEFYEQRSRFGTLPDGDCFFLWQDQTRIRVKDLDASLKQGIELAGLFKA
ncbi:MAG: hypothetical protein P1U77_27420 [Rubripirellula sp.]|nr:hypothetical protein [Rubripirellula sp.]